MIGSNPISSTIKSPHLADFFYLANLAGASRAEQREGDRFESDILHDKKSAFGGLFLFSEFGRSVPRVAAGR